ncbi:hypothetical protein GCM10010170_063700 [Dactylosporangium salmoneum]|uniref:Peptidase MA superfamily protein n=1 Tax=Dactylosporangium salmoneum TaxID=53361 RepID=A0ABP5U0P7_9ACTN
MLVAQDPEGPGETTEPVAYQGPRTTVTGAGLHIPQQRGPEMYTPAAYPSPASPPPSYYPPQYPAGYWPGQPPLPPRPRRRGLVATGVVGAAVLVLALLIGIAFAGSGGRKPVAGDAHPLAARSTAAGAAATATGSPKAETGVSGPILNALGKQSKALLAGDRDGYLAGLGGGLQDGFARRFGSLRAMGVQTWTPSLVDRPSQNADGTWSTLVRWDYCFGQGCTQTFPQVVQTSWTVSGNTATVAKYEQTSEPWDASVLQTSVGRHVIVAGTAASASKLQRVVAKADAAADVADRFAKWDPPPKWYIVYIAGEGEWKSWWDNGDIGANYDGYSTGPRGIVMQAADAGQDFLQILLTHEFGHVVTVGEDYGTAKTWWMTEGIADYIANGDGRTMQGRLPSVRWFVKHGWDGTITLGPPPESAGGEEISGRYGVALIAINCLAKKFTEPKMLDFFGEVVRKQASLEDASAKVFGTEWAGVASSCAGQVRNA